MNPLDILKNARLEVAGRDDKAWKFLLNAYNYVYEAYPEYKRMANPNVEFWEDYR